MSTKKHAADDEFDDKSTPKHGTATPADPGGEIPRVIDENERAPAGFTRFKIECRNYLPQAKRYILAKKDDEKGARDHYLKVNALDKRMESMKAGGMKEFEPPFLVITKLPD